MNVLSLKLKAEIESRPTDTYLRSDYSHNNEKEHIKLIKFADIPDKSIKIPDQFDGRKVWEGMLIPVANQGTCGSCWSFASTSTLSDRFNIQSVGQMYVELSPAQMILCDIKSSGIKHPEINTEAESERQIKSNKLTACFGNSLADAWRYLYNEGVPTEQCVPYNKKYGKFKEFDTLSSFIHTESMPTCTYATGILGDMCSDFTFNEYNAEETGTPAKFYQALHFYAIAGVSKDGGGEINIRYNIFRWGPVSTSFAVYPDFYTFDAKKSIYEWDGIGTQVGGHAVEIVGWGFEKNKKYWIVKNSWGTEWGDSGYFKMIRGINNCQFEENIITGVPDYFYPLTDNLTTIGQIWSESIKDVEKRRQRNMDVKKYGGGIDPITGYSRRVMTTMPWVDLNRPIKLKNLPNYKNWVAGIDSSKKNRIKYSNLKYADNSFYYVITSILSILVIFLIISAIIYLVKKR